MNTFPRSRAVRTLLLLGLAVPCAVQAQQKVVAYVDTRAILEAAPGRVEADAQLQREGSAMQVTLSKMNDAYVALMSEYSKLPPTTAQADRDKKAKTIQDRQAELQQKQQEFQDTYNQRQGELLQPILDQVKLVLEDVRTEMGYSFILDIGGQAASIVAADKNLNISDRVIAKLRLMPKPTIAARSDSAKADPKKTAGPLNAPAGVGRPGASGAPSVTPPKKPDSTVTKRPDSTATKRPDSTATKKP